MGVSVACIAHRGRQVFIAHRIAGGDMGGRWEFPGGKVEEGESCAAAACREMREEFGVEVAIGRRIAEGHFVHGGDTRRLVAYEMQLPPGADVESFVLTEHSECKWADVDEIAALPFVDSDMSIYPAVKRWVAQDEGAAR